MKKLLLFCYKKKIDHIFSNEKKTITTISNFHESLSEFKIIFRFSIFTYLLVIFLINIFLVLFFFLFKINFIESIFKIISKLPILNIKNCDEIETYLCKQWNIIKNN